MAINNMSSIIRHRASDQVEFLDIQNKHATARVSLFGGQVLSYIPHRDGREKLYVSRSALFDGSKPIRGGIPLCWPWFAKHPGDADCPFHGFVRNRQWHLVEEDHADVATTLLLHAVDTTSDCFAGTAELFLKILVSDHLTLELITKNTGMESFSLTCAMHSYFAVDDIRQTVLEGLSGRYSDKVRDFAHFETPAEYRFSEETDRIHLSPCPDATIKGMDMATRVASSGHDSIVVWNPWTACHENFPDMEPEDYLHMLCVETAVTSGITVAPGQRHILRQEIY